MPWGSKRRALLRDWQSFPKLGLLICCCAEKIGHRSVFEGELIQVYWWLGLFGRAFKYC